MSFVCLFVCFWHNSPQWVRASSFVRFLDHTQRRTTVGRIPLDEWSARRRDLYLTTHTTLTAKYPCPPVGFEPITSAGERPQTYALDRAATGTGDRNEYQEYLLRGKGGRCVQLTTVSPSCADCLETWEPQPPWSPQGLPRRVQGLLCLLFCIVT